MNELSIRFAQVDPAAKADITALTVNQKKPWSTPDDLRVDGLPPPGNYATMEHNYTVLDGTMDEFPDDTDGKVWGWWSNTYSDANGNFSAPPTLDITFAENHKSRGLTFYFYPHTDDYAKTVRVTWYNSSGGTIKTGTYTLDSVIGIVYEAVENFRRLKIEMLTTNVRHRYIKLMALDYGIIRNIRDEEVNSCAILEEIDPTVESISINTLNAQIRTREAFFNPVSGELADEMMMKRQILTVTRGGVPFGTFFLDEWEDVYESGIVFNFKANDAVGVLDLYKFKGGIYTNKLVSELLTEIFAVAFPTQLVGYELDQAYSASRVSGWIPLGTCGEAFQHIMFAVNAIADTSRSGNILIYPRETAVKYTVDLRERYRRGSIKATEYYSGVDVVSHSYTPGTETSEVHNGTLPAGRHTIEFTEPLHSLTVSGGTITASGANYAEINVTAQGTVTLTGKRYVDNRQTHSVRAEVAAGEVESVKQFENFTLVSPSAGAALAQKLFDYMNFRLAVNGDVVLGDKEVGYVAKVQTRGLDVTGVITSLDINLRANKAGMEVIGNVG